MEYWGEKNSEYNTNSNKTKNLSSFKQYFKKNPSKFNRFITMILGFHKEVYIDPIEAHKAEAQAAINSKIERNQAAQKMGRAKEEQRKIHKAKQEISKIVDNLIIDKDEAKLLIVLTKGYHLNEEQAFSLIDSKFTSEEVKNAIIYSFNQSIKNSITTSLSELTEFENADKELWKTYKRDDYSSIFKEKISILSNKIVLIWEYTEYSPLNEDDKFVIQFLNACKNTKRVINSFEDMKFSGRINFEKKINQYIADIEEQKKDVVEAQFIKHLEKFKLAFDNFEDMKKNIVSDILNNIKNFKEQDLSIESKEAIKEIHKIYSEINSELLLIEQQLDLTNLYKKRLPQVVEEYIMVSPRYKEKLKQHNESPDRLLLDSLHEIKTGINEIFNTIQEKNITQLKISNQYLKNKNKKI